MIIIRSQEDLSQSSHLFFIQFIDDGCFFYDALRYIEPHE